MAMIIDDVEVEAFSAKYLQGRNVAIVLIETDTREVYANLTVNIDPLPAGEAAVDTNNIPEAPEFIKKYKLGEDTGKVLQSGYCTYPVYKFFLDKIPELKR